MQTSLVVSLPTHILRDRLTYNTSATAMQMANSIFGNGVTVTGATYSGSSIPLRFIQTGTPSRAMSRRVIRVSFSQPVRRRNLPIIPASRTWTPTHPRTRVARTTMPTSMQLQVPAPMTRP